ncbi:MAG: Ig-like domain-containing protein, partial [Acidobacteriota bacterium]|nr:Ig-like domain-containing protein [Acidobacteriota bacterium]
MTLNKSRSVARCICAGFACVLLAAACPTVALCRPSVAITAPADQASVSGQTWINLAFRSDTRRQIVRLELQLDGREAQAYILPVPLVQGQKTFPLDASMLPPGPHVVSVRAFDSLGETGDAQVTINVAGAAPGASPAGMVDRVPPVVTVYYPAQGATVSGTVQIRAEATDQSGVRSVLFYVDGKLHTVRMNTPPYTATWDTTRYSEGPHVIETRAKDNYDNEGLSAPVTVIVANRTPELAAPGPNTGETSPWPGMAGAPVVHGPAAGGTDGRPPTIVPPTPGGDSLPPVTWPPAAGGGATEPIESTVKPVEPSGSATVFQPGARPGVIEVREPRLSTPPATAVVAGDGTRAPGADATLAPPPLEHEAPLPTGGKPRTFIPGIDLSATPPVKPELAVDETPPPLSDGNGAELAAPGGTAPDRDLAPSGAIILPDTRIPAPEPVLAPELSVPSSTSEAPRGSGARLARETPRTDLVTAPEGAVLTPQVPEPATEPLAGPVAEPAAEPAADPAAEPAAEPAADPAAPRAAEPAAHPDA